MKFLTELAELSGTGIEVLTEITDLIGYPCIDCTEIYIRNRALLQEYTRTPGKGS